MNGLRAILLLAGLLFIAALIWLERRRPSRVQPEADVRSGREEPAFGFQDAEVASTGSGTPRGPDPGRALPLIDWSTPVGAAPPDPPLMEVAELAPVRTLPDTTASAGVAASQGEQAQPLRVELPAEEARRHDAQADNAAHLFRRQLDPQWLRLLALTGSDASAGSGVGQRTHRSELGDLHERWVGRSSANRR
jgi:hypothetical protein